MLMTVQLWLDRLYIQSLQRPRGGLDFDWGAEQWGFGIGGLVWYWKIVRALKGVQMKDGGGIEIELRLGVWSLIFMHCSANGVCRLGFGTDEIRDASQVLCCSDMRLRLRSYYGMWLILHVATSLLIPYTTIGKREPDVFTGGFNVGRALDDFSLKGPHWSVLSRLQSSIRMAGSLFQLSIYGINRSISTLARHL